MNGDTNLNRHREASGKQQHTTRHSYFDLVLPCSLLVHFLVFESCVVQSFVHFQSTILLWILRILVKHNITHEAKQVLRPQASPLAPWHCCGYIFSVVCERNTG